MQTTKSHVCSRKLNEASKLIFVVVNIVCHLAWPLQHFKIPQIVIREREWFWLDLPKISRRICSIAFVYAVQTLLCHTWKCDNSIRICICKISSVTLLQINNTNLSRTQRNDSIDLSGHFGCDCNFRSCVFNFVLINSIDSLLNV